METPKKPAQAPSPDARTARRCSEEFHEASGITYGCSKPAGHAGSHQDYPKAQDARTAEEDAAWLRALAMADRSTAQEKRDRLRAIARRLASPPQAASGLAPRAEATDGALAEEPKQSRHGCTVTLSYEEQIINVLMGVSRKRGEDTLAWQVRKFNAIREVLKPLHAALAQAQADARQRQAEGTDGALLAESAKRLAASLAQTQADQRQRQAEFEAAIQQRDAAVQARDAAREALRALDDICRKHAEARQDLGADLNAAEAQARALREALEKAQAAIADATRAMCDRERLGPSDLEAHYLHDASLAAMNALAAVPPAANGGSDAVR